MPRSNNLSKKLKVLSELRHEAVVIPQETAETYEQEAKALGKDLGSILSQRLVDAQAWNAETPLYFTDDQRHELERLLDSNFNHPKQVIDKLRSLLTVIRIKDDAGFEDLTLSPDQIYRLAERARMAAVSISQKAKAIANNAINMETGLY